MTTLRSHSSHPFVVPVGVAPKAPGTMAAQLLPRQGIISHCGAGLHVSILLNLNQYCCNRCPGTEWCLAINDCNKHQYHPLYKFPLFCLYLHKVSSHCHLYVSTTHHVFCQSNHSTGLKVTDDMMVSNSYTNYHIQQTVNNFLVHWV